jgi:uncharacterized membrane protein YhaH (DUF805 family)
MSTPLLDQDLLSLAFPRTIGRLEFVIRSIGFLIIWTGSSWILINGLSVLHALQVCAIVFCLITVLVYPVIGILIPRARDAGMEPMLLWLLLLPVINWFFWLLLLIAPTNREAHPNQSPQATAKPVG